jgi:hypothetical protein
MNKFRKIWLRKDHILKTNFNTIFIYNKEQVNKSNN